MHVQLESLFVSLALANLAAPASAQLIVGAESNYALDAVWRIDVTTGERALLFYGGASAIAVDDAGGRIFTANIGQLSVWNYGGGPSATVLGNLTDPSGLPFQPSGMAFGAGRLVATREDFPCSGWLFEIDLTTLVALPLPTPLTCISSKALSFEPSTGQFVMQGATGGLLRMDIFGGGAIQQIGTIGYPPDGGALGDAGAYYVVHDRGLWPIAKFDLATNSYTQTTYWAPYYGTGQNAGADWAPSLVLPPGPRVYCEPRLPGVPEPLRPTYTGTPSASAGGGFTITHAPLSDVNSRVQPHISLVGPAQVPFHTGQRCLRLPVLRLPHQVVANGVHSFDFNAYLASGANPALVAGQTVWYQVIEVPGPYIGTPPLSLINLGPGVSFTILP